MDRFAFVAGYTLAIVVLIGIVLGVRQYRQDHRVSGSLVRFVGALMVIGVALAALVPLLPATVSLLVFVLVNALAFAVFGWVAFRVWQEEGWSARTERFVLVAMISVAILVIRLSAG